MGQGVVVGAVVVGVRRGEMMKSHVTRVMGPQSVPNFPFVPGPGDHRNLPALLLNPLLTAMTTAATLTTASSCFVVILTTTAAATSASLSNNNTSSGNLGTGEYKARSTTMTEVDRHDSGQDEVDHHDSRQGDDNGKMTMARRRQRQTARQCRQQQQRVHRHDNLDGEQ
ncbi:hypothetical protein EDB89DRAFT_1907628 [Lactarius sanguifluus]|nr:hypothetical protein EDB89DRAFT_1907628 [Lactarius sanguifluus]